MSEMMTVEVQPEYRITLPSIVHEKLKLQEGDELLIDVQDGIIVMIPKPKDFVVAMAGLYKETWQGIDTTE
ncbi:AbrB/MazE/SpoVT family DNA-binding domain-containing protein [Anaerolineales bacterium HSG25]|nr:AbrB/MazE/SpoVT family DNA-binding domain-containing protein [Anaerolineales bacterium HSG25]